MIHSSDQPGRSSDAIYTIWNRKKTKTYFPVIFSSWGLSQVQDHLNDWLFKTGYIKDWEYSAEYAVAVNVDHATMGSKLNEIFSTEIEVINA